MSPIETPAPVICDGSVISANLGVNPSLTITAVAEHALSHVQPAGTAAAFFLN